MFRRGVTLSQIIVESIYSIRYCYPEEMNITKEIDIEAICADQEVVIHHVGMRDGNLRIILSVSGDDHPSFVVKCDVCRSYYQAALEPQAVLVRCIHVGSFGWWLVPYLDDYTQIEVRHKNDRRVVITAVARNVCYRRCDSKAVDMNYPG